MSKTGFAISAASIFLASACTKKAPVTAAAAQTATTTNVKCAGVNECKGTSKCGMPGAHSCAGQNECKGKGWIETSAEDCAAKAGSVVQ